MKQVVRAGSPKADEQGCFSHYFLFGLLLSFVTCALQAGELSQELETVALANSAQPVSVIIDIPSKLDVDKLRQNRNKIPRAELIIALKSHAESTQSPALRFLEKIHAKKIKSLWMVNKISAEIPASQLRQVAAMPGVGLIKKNRVVKLAN